MIITRKHRDAILSKRQLVLTKRNSSKWQLFCFKTSSCFLITAFLTWIQSFFNITRQDDTHTHTPITGITYSSRSMSTPFKVFCWPGRCLWEWLTFEEQNILTLPLDKNNSVPNTTWQLWLPEPVVRLNNSQCKVNMNILSLSQSD